MSWYYAIDGKQMGPVSETEFEASLKAGTITDETLVWREGFPQWTKYSEVGSTVGNSNVSLQAVVAGAEAKCVECGNPFSQDEMVNFGGAWVCGACKPHYVQKLKEGVAANSSYTYAGFWIRFAAKFVDGLILQVVNMGFGAVLGLGMASHVHRGGANLGFIGLIYLVTFGTHIAYSTFFVGKYGATPGKMALRLKVIRPGGEPMTYGRAFGRWASELLNGFTIGIGYMMAGWDSEKRALHDRIADTRVVRVES